MVAAGGFLLAVEVVVEGVAAFPSGTVYTLEHRSVFIAAPVSPGDGEEFYGGDVGGGGDMGPLAEVDKVAVAVDA